MVIKNEEPKRGTPVGWKPASELPKLVARKGFTAKWIRNEPANVARKQEEGWVLMTSKDNVGIQIRSDADSNSLGTEIRYRDLVGMMLSDELKEAREHHFREQNQQAQRQVLRQTDAGLKSAGVSTYTPKGMQGRIVIE